MTQALPCRSARLSYQPTKDEPESTFQEAERLLAELRPERKVPARIDRVSSIFLGRPYTDHPLDTTSLDNHARETLTVSFEGFDCVTYIETVLALALSETADGFLTNLREIRYEDGLVAWEKRNHYMVDWAKNNVERGVLIDLNAAGPLEKRRTLSVVEGLPERAVVIRCFPKRHVIGLPFLATGDLIMFVSTKKNLDVFHTGLIVRTGSESVLRHATRQQGEVVEEALSAFLSSQRMSGAMLFRPAKEAI